MSRFALFTDALDVSGDFDPRYTCELDNSSPEMKWADPPAEAQGFALTVEDIDSPKGPLEPLSHWLIYMIPSSLRHLPAGIPAQDTLPNGIRQGINSYGRLGYTGPCPPHGSPPHRYRFRLYALSENVEIPPRIKRDELLARIDPYSIETCEFFGHYQRLKKAG